MSIVTSHPNSSISNSRSLNEFFRAAGDGGEPPMPSSDVIEMLVHLMTIEELFCRACNEINEAHFDPATEAALIAIWLTAQQLYTDRQVIPTSSNIRSELERLKSLYASHGQYPDERIDAALAQDGILDQIDNQLPINQTVERGAELVRRFLLERDVIQQFLGIVRAQSAFGEQRLPTNFAAAIELAASRTAEINAAWGTDDTWPAIEPLDGAELPCFPLDALPMRLREWVNAESIATQTPPDMPAMIGLAVCAAAAAKGVKLRVSSNYSEPINIYIVVAMEPGNRKSAVLTSASEPLRSVERDRVESTAADVRQYDSRVRILTKRQQRFEQQAANAASDPERDDLSRRAVDTAAELAGLTPFYKPKLLVNDCTVEQLEIVLAEQQGRIAILNAEGGVFAMMKGRYSKTPNFEVYLQGHSGEELRTDRVGRHNVFVADPAITIGVAVQPEVIREFGEVPEFRGKGLSGRILYSLPRSLLGHRNSSPPEVTPAIKDSYNSMVRAIASLAPQCRILQPNTLGAPRPQELTLSSEADARRLSFMDSIETRLRAWGELAGIKEWASKLPGAVVRLAGILHLARQAEHHLESMAGQNHRERIAGMHLFQPWNTPIALETMQGAVAIGDYLVPHALAAFRMMGMKTGLRADVVANAYRVLAWIRRSDRRCFTKRDVYQGNRSHFGHANEIDPVLDLLVQKHFIRPISDSIAIGRSGRPPSPRYCVNPAVRSLPLAEAGL